MILYRATAVHRMSMDNKNEWLLDCQRLLVLIVQGLSVALHMMMGLKKLQSSHKLWQLRERLSSTGVLGAFILNDAQGHEQEDAFFQAPCSVLFISKLPSSIIHQAWGELLCRGCIQKTVLVCLISPGAHKYIGI